MEKEQEQEQKTGLCRECGCTWNNACFNPTHGNCWWVDDSETLCSHCYIDEINNDPKTIHPNKRSKSKNTNKSFDLEREK